MYIYQKKANIPVYHVQGKNLELYTTTEQMFKKGKSMVPNKQARNFDEDLYVPKEEADSPSPQLKLSAVKPLTLGISLPDSSSDDNDDNDNEVDFPESLVELEDKKGRRRQQLLEDMQGFYNEGSSEDSDESSFFTEQSRGTIDVRAKARISLEEDAEETKKVHSSSEEDDEAR